jgi:hypothetical protein
MLAQLNMPKYYDAIDARSAEYIMTMDVGSAKHGKILLCQGCWLS